MQVLLDLPEVGGLPPEGGAVHILKFWEQVGVMAAKVGENAAIGVVTDKPQVHASKFANKLGGHDHAVTHGRARAALAQARSAKQVDQKIVYDAEHGGNKVVKRHGRQVGYGKRESDGLHLIPKPRRPACSYVCRSESKKLAHAITYDVWANQPSCIP